MVTDTRNMSLDGFDHDLMDVYVPCDNSHHSRLDTLLSWALMLCLALELVTVTGVVIGFMLLWWIIVHGGFWQ